MKSLLPAEAGKERYNLLEGVDIRVGIPRAGIPAAGAGRVACWAELDTEAVEPF